MSEEVSIALPVEEEQDPLLETVKFLIVHGASPELVGAVIAQQKDTPPVYSLYQIERMAEAVTRSGLFGIKTIEQAVALMLIAQAEGRHPATVARDFDIIQGRPAKKADAVLRDFLSAGGAVKWHEISDQKADATFSHPSAIEPVRIDWNLERARQAGLLDKDNWKKYPRPMLRARCISEGVKTVYPMATSGMYVPEEMQDYRPVPVRSPAPPAAKDKTPKPAAAAPAEFNLNERLEWLKNAKDADELRSLFGDAYKRAAGQKAAQDQLKVGYELRKAELSKPPQETF
jgi:hypothetical protein